MFIFVCAGLKGSVESVSALKGDSVSDSPDCELSSRWESYCHPPSGSMADSKRPLMNFGTEDFSPRGLRMCSTLEIALSLEEFLAASSIAKRRLDEE